MINHENIKLLANAPFTTTATTSPRCKGKPPLATQVV